MDLSSLPEFRDRVGQFDEVNRECYLYKSQAGYELLGYLTDDRILVDTIKKGTKVKVSQVIRTYDRRRAFPGSDVIIHSSTLTPLLNLVESKAIRPTAPVRCSPTLLTQFPPVRATDYRFEFKK
jgi:hypothetical protein